ncbi:uncharacterized protein LOC117333449 [Pecten maximus]|uniref:uncharacterized protein LOC117333449 n=1 Tax=Pecten maximus TaxID=6579 RepID=UPI0014586366|nr:uncharacterized protein LOC117333449 [Pecten maximus]
MAIKVTTISFIITAFIVVITIVIMSVPNLISYKLSLSVTAVMKILNITSGGMPGMIQPAMYPMDPHQQPEHIETTLQPLDIGDYHLGVSLGIYRCELETRIPSVPTPLTWDGTYVSLGDKFETTANQMMAAIDPMDVAKSKLIFGDGAVSAFADLIRTLFVRAEIEVTVALLFLLIALAMTFINVCVKDGQTNPFVITSAAICFLIHSILLGVALGAFAQQLQQMSTFADMFTMVKITDKGYGILALGFLIVLASILLTLEHLRMLVFPKEPYKRFGQNEEPVSYSARENFNLGGEYNV